MTTKNEKINPIFNIGIYQFHAMHKLIIFLLLIVSNLLLVAQTNISLVGQLSYEKRLSDVWGYVDETGIEYGLVGGLDNFSVVSLEDPTNPIEIFSTLGPETIWRDIKVWNDHAYITNESGQGLLIVDLSPLPESTDLPFHYYEDDWTRAHNLFIDENGVCYIFGADKNEGGALMYDLTQDPENPVYLGMFDQWYAHDGMARGDTLYMGHIWEGTFSVVDVSDKANPVVLATQSTSFNFTHNVWVSDDGNYLFTTDEIAGAFIGSYDISDLENIEHLDDWQSTPGSHVIPHNSHVYGDFLVTSYYADGLSILDISNPSNLVEVAQYDESVNYGGSGFNGAWGAYPYLPSGLVLVTDIEEGLFVFDVNYVRACYLEGKITAESNGAPLNGVYVEINEHPISTYSNYTGDYGAGFHSSGIYSVSYSKYGYFTEIYEVNLESGITVIQDVEMRTKEQYAISGIVKDEESQYGLANATISLYDDYIMYDVEADQNGSFSVDTIFEGTYQISIAQWGHLTYCGEVTISNTTQSLVFELTKGYEDHFNADLGWEVINKKNLIQGIWERVDPIGAYFQGYQSAPENDSDVDCLNKAYITGQSVDTSIYFGNLDPLGKMVLKSPSMDLSSYNNPYINYYTWFFNYGNLDFGSYYSPPNDYMALSVTNGQDSVIIDLITQEEISDGEWKEQNVKLNDFIAISDDMHLYVIIEDIPSNDYVEGGFDAFLVTEGPTNVSEIEMLKSDFSFYPNPVQGSSTIYFSDEFMQIKVMDMNGRIVYHGTDESKIDLPALSPGVYLLNRMNRNFETEIDKFIVID